MHKSYALYSLMQSHVEILLTMNDMHGKFIYCMYLYLFLHFQGYRMNLYDAYDTSLYMFSESYKERNCRILRRRYVLKKRCLLLTCLHMKSPLIWPISKFVVERSTFVGLLSYMALSALTHFVVSFANSRCACIYRGAYICVLYTRIKTIYRKLFGKKFLTTSCCEAK